MTFFFNRAVIAHRGDSCRYPENTLAAINGAIRVHAVMAEVDLSLSLDGEIFLLHDRSLERTTDGHGIASKKDWKYLSGLDAGLWKNSKFALEPLARLRDLLLLCQGQLALNLEIKPETYVLGGACFIDQLLAQLVELKMVDQVVLSSFSMPCLLELAAREDRPSLGWLSDQPLNDEVRTHLVAHHFWGFHTSKEAVNPADGAWLAQRNLQYLCYTVNDAQEAYRLFDLGVNAVFSDDPRLISPEG